MAEVRADVAEAAQAGQDVADQGLVLVCARFERGGEIDIDVDDAVAFVEDADGLDVVGTAGAVGGLEGAAELDVGVIVHVASIHQKPAPHRGRHAKSPWAGRVKISYKFSGVWGTFRQFQGLEDRLIVLRLGSKRMLTVRSAPLIASFEKDIYHAYF